MRLHLATAIMMALTIALGAQAYAASPVIDEFKVDRVKQAFKDAGVKGITHEKRDDSITVIGKDDTGLTIVGVIVACESKPGCLGLELEYIFSMPTGKSANMLSVNAFNRRYQFAKAHISENGMVRLTRYLIADEGITYANLRRNVQVFMAMPARFMNELKLVDAPTS
jgi:hypothetical protein